MFSQGPPPKTSSYPKPDLNICVGFAELFSQTFFSSCREKVTWGLDPHPLTKMSQLSPKERDSCWVCALLIGAEFMVKSEAPPRKLCQPWSTGSLKISTKENYTLKHIHAFVYFFSSCYYSDGPGNRTQKSICMPGKPSSLVLISSLPFFHHISHR